MLHSCWKRQEQKCHKIPFSFCNCSRMLVKQYKSNCKEIYFSKVSDLYRQLISLGSIFEQLFSISIQNNFSWLHLITHTSSTIFIYLFLKSFSHKNRIWKQFSLKFLARKFKSVFSGFLGISCLIIKKRRNQLKYFQAPQSSYCS